MQLENKKRKLGAYHAPAAEAKGRPVCQNADTFKVPKTLTDATFQGYTVTGLARHSPLLSQVIKVKWLDSVQTKLQFTLITETS